MSIILYKFHSFTWLMSEMAVSFSLVVAVLAPSLDSSSWIFDSNEATNEEKL